MDLMSILNAMLLLPSNQVDATASVEMRIFYSVMKFKSFSESCDQLF